MMDGKNLKAGNCVRVTAFISFAKRSERRNPKLILNDAEKSS